MSGFSEKYWGRAGHIEIDGVTVPTNGLDFKFDIEKIGDVYPKWKASILGLSLDTIRKITVWNPAVAVSQMRGIRIYAGYNGIIGEKLLCNGTIMNAMPTQPPEMWLNMSGMMSFKDRRMISEPYKIRNKTKEEIFKEICGKIGKPCRYEVKNDQYAKIKGFQFVFEGMYGDLPAKFAAQFDFIVYLDDDTLVCTDKNAQLQKPKKRSKPEIIDIEHGLISVAGVDVKGATIRTRLNDSYKLMDWVELHSELVPSANGVYYVIKKHHVGHLRGDDWYTELTTIRKAY